MKPENLKTLVRAAQAGDVDAFGDLYAALRQDLFRFAYYQLSSPHRAEDAVSDCVLRAFQNITKLKKAQSVRSWFCSILLNCCREQQREKAIAAKQVDLDECCSLLATEKDYASHAALHAALRQLPDDDRELLLLSVLFGYDSKELADLLGSKSGTIRSRLSRVKATLRAMLSEGDEPQ